MHYPARGGSRERHTLCISSQAGCAVGCPFCATGELGFGRDLETAEILDQVRHAARRLAADERRLTNIVFMGMGEPLLNLDRVLAAVEALNDPGRFGLGARHITVSTSGVVPGIRRLTALGPQFTLAISLHAARDALRDVLVPLNRRWPVAEVVEAARAHGRATGRRISYEVTMIGGVNDTTLDATAMADLLRGDHAHVNLIPMNPVAHTPWTASPMPVIEASRPRSGRPASGRRSGATAARRSARRAASWPRNGRASPAPVPWPAAASGSSPRARPRCAANAVTTPCRSGWGSSRGYRPGAGRREHPRRRPLEPRVRGPPDPEGRDRPDPPRRHGRPLRAEPHVRGQDHQGAPAADRAAVRRPPDDQRARPVHRGVPRCRLRLDHHPRRDRGADRADAAGHPRRRSCRGPVRQAGHAARGPRAVRAAPRHRHGHDRRARVRRADRS